MSSPSARRRAVAAPIRKGTSLPQDENEPSFLTTLPPEIRNTIYEHLFLRDGPVEIVDAHEYTKPPAWEIATQDFEEDYDGEDRGDGSAEQPLIVHECSFPVAFLRSCRQMYAEASGILYGANEFIISASTHRHNHHLRQLLTAVRWMKGIGSLYQLLNRIFVDTGTLCPDECSDYRTWLFEFTPLIKLLWARTNTKCQIVFAYTGKTGDARLHTYLPPPPTPDTEALNAQATKMNNMFQSLMLYDDLGIQRYARHDTLIESIEIHSDLREGDIHFSSSDPNAFVGRRFTISKDVLSLVYDAEILREDIMLRPYGAELALGLLSGLTMRVRSECFRYATTSAKPIIFDIDKRTSNIQSFGLFSVNNFWRKTGLQYFMKRNGIIIRLRTRDTHTTFQNFAALRSWAQESVSDFFPHA